MERVKEFREDEVSQGDGRRVQEGWGEGNVG